MELKAVFYDLDGTVIDTVAIHREAWKFAAAKFNIELTPEMLLDQKGMTGDEFTRMVFEKYGLSDKEKEWQFWTTKIDYLENIYGGAAIFEGFFETVEALNKMGLKVMICTGMPEKFVKMIPGLKAFENNIVWREMYDKGKPSADPLLVTAAKAGVKPGDCAYVGDAHSDYLSAQAAGMQFFYYNPPGSEIDPRLATVTGLLQSHAEILKKI